MHLNMAGINKFKYFYIVTFLVLNNNYQKLHEIFEVKLQSIPLSFSGVYLNL